jgi:hypothetical protein
MISVWIVIAWLLGSAVMFALATLAVLFFAYRARVRGFVSQARSARYVVTYEDALQWLGVRYRERGRLTRELRANIADAAADASVPEVLTRMGSAKELARGVAARRRGPTWLIGGIAAVIMIAVQELVTILMNVSFISAVKAGSVPNHMVTGTVLPGLTFGARLGDSGVVDSLSAHVSSWWLILSVLAFVLWSRPWRLLTARTARHASESEGKP